jgi:poly-gamma-glutamate synthesis protein (capsule biosynthesis protein)
VWIFAAVLVGVSAGYVLSFYYQSSMGALARIIERPQINTKAAIKSIQVEASAKAAVNSIIDYPARLSATTTTLIFVGDIMLDRGVFSSIERYGDGNFDYIFKYATATKTADLTFGNLEGPISDGGRNMGSIYSFRMKPDAAKALFRAGFDVLSIANNHAGDWGPQALADTIDIVEEQGVAVVGAGENLSEAQEIRIVQINGVKIGFLAFSDVGPNWLNASTTKPGILIAESPERVEQVVENNANVSDVLVVSFHFGDEYAAEPSSRQMVLARAAIDAGAHIVAGHHPHVVQKVESYNGGIIVYSLGNFIFDQNFSEETMRGGALEVLMMGKQIVGYKLREVVINDRFQAVIE